MHFFSFTAGAIVGAAGAIIIKAIATSMNETNGEEIRIDELEQLTKEELFEYFNSCITDISKGKTFLLYVRENTFTDDMPENIKRSITKLIKNNNLFEKQNDFIVQVVYSAENKQVITYRIILFDDIEEELNEILLGADFYNKNIVELT